MSKDKQIEEMAKVMLEASTNANVEPVLEMEGKEVVLGDNATKVINNILEQAFIPFLAEVLYNAGYRKASDIARKIFWEIERTLDNYHSACCPIGEIETYSYYEGGLEKAIAELKKKYESEDTE